MTDADLIKFLDCFVREAKEAKTSRMQYNDTNYEMYNMQQDFSHKRKGQSREFIPKVTMAVDQGANLIQQGLVDLGDWFRVEAAPGVDESDLQIKPHMIKNLLGHYMSKMDYFSLVGDQLKSGMLGSLIVLKVHGEMKEYPRYVSKEEMVDGKMTKQLVRIKDKYYCPKVEIVRQGDYYKDPTGDGLGEAQDCFIDYYKLKQLAENELSGFDKAAVARIAGQAGSEVVEHQADRARETNQNVASQGYRKRVKLTEYWGNVIDADGNLVYENVTFIVADDKEVVKKPTANPQWHKKSPFISEPLISIPNSVWHRAVMDAPALLNRVINELTNLIIDGGMMSVHGIKQLRKGWLDDPEQVEDGITAGDTLIINDTAPPQGKVIERVDTGAVGQETLTVLNLIQQEFNAAAMTNDLRQGVQPFRQVKATEIVEASQSLTSMLSGIAKNLEEKVITKTLELIWMNLVQHKEYLEESFVIAALGEKDGRIFLDMPVEDLFAETVNGCKFKVFGVSHTLNKQRDFTKMQALLQTVFSAEPLMEEFVKKYSFSKLLMEVLRNLDIDEARLRNDEPEDDLVAAGLSTPGQEADMQSQIAQAGAPTNQGDLTMESAIPQTQFPGSPATTGQ